MNLNSPPPLDYTSNRLAGKVIFVTGASSGIGEAAVRRFAAEGAKIAAVARRIQLLRDLSREQAREGHDVIPVECDVTDEASVKDAVERTVGEFGRIDGAFNNAGRGSAQMPLHQISTEQFDRVIALNLRGPFLCMKYQIPHMLASGLGGSIVLCSSVHGLIGGANASDYAASKWGLAGLLKSAALDYAAQGIRVNAVAPGPTRSEMYDKKNPTDALREASAAKSPMRQVSHPDDIARTVLFLLSDEARWTTGCVLPADGGMANG